MIEIINNTQDHIPRQLISNVLNHTCRYLKLKKLDLSVVFVSRALIKKLNSKYRHKKQATDILSFGYEKTQAFLNGEIIICYSLVKANASKYLNSVKQELVKTLIHGLLHLLGYTHERHLDAQKMARLESKIIQSLKI